MATEKGIFKDDVDRFTEAHFNICTWFLKNAGSFVRRFLFDCPMGTIKVTLEHLIAHNKFIIGYADVLLEYQTDTGTRECILIEVKSRLADPAACLRQLRAYREHLSAVTKICVVHSDDRYESCSDPDEQMRTYFASQGIFVCDFQSPFWNPHYCSLPSGRREVRIDHANAQGYSFDLWLCGQGFDERTGEEAEVQIYLFGSGDQNMIRPFGKFLGVDVERWYFNWSLKPFMEMEGIRLLVDVVHPPAVWEGITAGWADEKYTAIHLPDLSRSFLPASGDTFR